jgi:NADH-quinone oxidoreductase subunit M
MILALPWIPFAAAVLVLLTPKELPHFLKRITITSCAVCFFITLWYVFKYDPSYGGFQFVQSYSWLPALGINYQVGFDGINLTLCLLHAIVSLAGAFVACSTKHRLKEFVFYYLILVAAIYGVFSILDIFFLYLFYELTLIPHFPMIGIWGSKNKEYSAMTLAIFITGGAILSLLGILLLYKETGFQTFDLIQLQQSLQAAPLSVSFQKLAAPLILIGFGVIASLWPLHSWSPMANAAAPTPVSMLDAGVLKKMGPYLIIRLVVGLLPEGMGVWSNALAALAGIGILYAGYTAIKQQDLRFMVGYSSVSHMGYVLLGIAAMTTVSLTGSIFLMFAHGIMAAASFAAVGFICDQTQARGIQDYGGLAKKAPFIGVSFVMISMASLGLPGFANFGAELLVFIGSWQRYPIIVCLAVFGVLITAIYLLRAIQSVCYGPVDARISSFKDATTLSEKIPFILLIGTLLLFGFWPQGLLRLIEPAVGVLIQP